MLFRIIYICLIFFITQLSCRCNNNHYPTSEEFYSLEDTIKGDLLDCSIITNSLTTRIYYSDYGLIIKTHIDNNIIQLVDFDRAKLITSYGRLGRGPNEFLSATSQHLNGNKKELNVLDFYKQELQLFKINCDTIIPLGIVNVKRDLQKASYINDSLIFYINFYPNQKIGIMDINGNSVYEEDFNIFRDKRIKTEKSYFTVHLKVSEDNNVVILANTKFSIVESYKFEDNQLQLNWHKALLEPKYSVKDGWYKFSSKDQALGFRNLYLTDKYIYLLCDDRSLNEVLSDKNKPHSYIVVMDYNGNIVNKYLLDRFFFSFAVNNNDTTLYAVVDDSVDFRIAKYNLL